MFGIIVTFILIFAAIFANIISPYPSAAYTGDLNDSLLSPSWQHLLGTDIQGRDTLSRLIFGSRTALLVGFVTVGAAAIAGMVLGLMAGFLGGVVNMIIMRIMDALMGFPMLVLALIISAVLGGGIQNVIIALGISTLPGYTRLMCGMTLTVKENDYILAEKALGASSFRTMLRHVMPNAIQPMIVLVTMMLGNVILAEAGLSFLGIGIKPPGAAWGSMVSDGYRYMLINPVLSFAPGFCIMLVVFAFNMVGDGLRDALDPRLRGTI
jgi:peptide/nickel transport system permease protein/oligopeptide transport system permease protein